MMRRLCILVGSPLWLPLLIILVAVVFSLCICLWACLASLVGSALAGIILSVVSGVDGNTLGSVGSIGVALICSGLSLLLFRGSRLATGASLLLTKNLFAGIHGCLAG